MQSPLQIVFKGIEKSAAIEARVKERAARLERFHRAVVSCRVVVEAAHRSAGGFKPALSIHIEVKIPRHTLVAKDTERQHDAKNDDMALINRAFDVLQRQLENEARIMRGDVKQHTGLNVRRTQE